MSNALEPDAVQRRPGSTGTLALARAFTLALSVAAIALVAELATSSVASAATAGTEVLVTPGTSRPLSSGGSATPYGVVLPSGAACPGDTAHKGYLIYSYLVPKGASPSDVSFRTGVPSRWFGYIAGGAYYGAVNTAESTGQIVGLPMSFVWTRLTPGDLFSNGAHTATWNGGIACADVHGRVTDYWNSTISFMASASDPHGFTWKVIDQGSVPSSFPLGLWVGVALLVVAAGAAAYALRLRRREDNSDPDSDGSDLRMPGPDNADGGGSGPEADLAQTEALSR